MWGDLNYQPVCGKQSDGARTVWLRIWGLSKRTELAKIDFAATSAIVFKPRRCTFVVVENLKYIPKNVHINIDFKKISAYSRWGKCINVLFGLF